MHIVTPQVGIDTSKDWLDVSVDSAAPSRIANTVSACELLSSQLPCGCHVHIEASGGYERTACRTLRKAGILVKVHDPQRVRRIAQAKASKAKTDAIDAKNLASFAQELPERAVKSLEHERMSDQSRAIEEAKRVAAQFRVRAQTPELDELAKQTYRCIASDLTKRAKELEAKFLKKIKKSSMGERFEIAKSVPCVGPVLARIAVCELPEDLSPYRPEQVAAYAGLAPIDNKSGKKNTKATIKRGNARLKAAVYMPAISAIKSQTWAKKLYAGLMAKGRAHQQAIVAVMRRLLIRLVAVLKRGSPWKDDPIES